MKLRTRIALIAGAVILLTTLLSDAAIFRICRRTLLDQAVSKAALESQSIARDFSDYFGALAALGAEQAEYYFKSKNDDYSVLIQGGTVLYNHTVLSPEVLVNRDTLLGPGGTLYFPLFLAGRRLLVFKMATGSYTLYHAADVTDTYLQLYSLLSKMVLISLSVAALAIAGLFFIVRRALSPLETLSDGTKSIAAGAYDRRVPEVRSDEIGALGRDFNRMAAAVEQNIAAVKESEEKKTLFMGSLTHELKTPLTSISGYAQTLRAVNLDEEDRAEALNYIVEESKRLDQLSKKMMRLLELDRETQLILEPVPANVLLEAAARTCAPQAAAAGVEIKVTPPAPGEIFTADKDLLTDAIVNLLDNAIKASPAGEKILLYTEDGGIVVEDHGRGIPEEEIGNLTEPFYMVDKSRSRQNGGAGLGLALTALILKRHGMQLHIQSAPGLGTKVTMFTI